MNSRPSALIYIILDNDVTQIGKINDIVNQAEAIDGVIWVNLVFGSEDMVAGVESGASTDRIVEIAVKIRSISGIRSTRTQIMNAGASLVNR